MKVVVRLVDKQYSVRRRSSDGEQVLAEMMPPVGLFGEATMISLVFGVIACMKFSNGNSSEASACTRTRCRDINCTLTSYMKNVGVAISASSSSSRNDRHSRRIASSTPFVRRS